MGDSTTQTETASVDNVPGLVRPEPLPFVSREHYLIDGLHARGGIGRILRARDLRLGRPVAIKELMRSDAVAELRFMREIRLTARLQHPTIVPVYEAGRWSNGTLFYAMKLVGGCSLKERLVEATSVAARLSLLPHVVAVAEAVAYAHSERIIHRDIKPSNVLIGPFGETVVIDWGLAKDLDAAPVSRYGGQCPGPGGAGRGEGPIVGTVGYMSPEQALGAEVDERADVYALGALLRDLLEPQARPTAAAPAGRGAKRAAASALNQPSSVPEKLASIVGTAMSRDPGDRFPGAGSFADALHRYASGAGWRAAPREY